MSSELAATVRVVHLSIFSVSRVSGAIDAGTRLRQQALLVNAAPAAAPRLTLVVSPSGHPRVVVAADERDAVTGAKGSAVAAAFEGGAGTGVLHLGAVEVGTSLPPAFAYFRELGHELIEPTRVGGLNDNMDPLCATFPPRPEHASRPE
jgi:hypothetical protein